MTMKKYCLTLTAALAVLDDRGAGRTAAASAALTSAEAAAADSLARPCFRAPGTQNKHTDVRHERTDCGVITLLPENDALLVVLYSNNTWK